MKILILLAATLYSFTVYANQTYPIRELPGKRPLISAPKKLPKFDKDPCMNAICQQTPGKDGKPSILDVINKKNGITALDYTGPCVPGKGCRPRQVCPRDLNEPCDPPVCEPDPQCT